MAFGFTKTLPTIAGSHTNFPVVLKTADFPAAAIDGGASSILNGGGNLRAYTDDTKATRLPVDIVRFVTGGSPDVEAHIRVPSAATGATIYIEADDVETVQPAVTNQYGRNAVWSECYAAYCFSSDPSAAAPQLIDRTGNGRHGTTEGGMTSGDLISTPTGRAWAFDGVDDAVALGSNADFNFDAAQSHTYEVVVRRDGDQSWQPIPGVFYGVIFGKGMLAANNPGGGIYYRHEASSPNRVATQIRNNSDIVIGVVGSTDISTAAFNSLSCVVNRSDQSLTVFLNGIAESSTSISSVGSLNNADQKAFVGLRYKSEDNSRQGFLKASVAYLFVYTSARSPEWLQSTRANRSATGSWGTNSAWVDGGAGITLAGSTESLSTQSGAATFSVPIAAATISLSTSSSTIVASVPMSAASASLSDSSGNVQASMSLQGSAIAAAVNQATLIAQGAMSAGSASSSDGQSTMTLSVALQGSTIAEAIISGQLAITPDGTPLSAMSAANSSAGSSLTHTIGMSGLSTSIADNDGVLATLVPVSGSSAVSSAMTGVLELSVTFDASSVAEALNSGTLNIKTDLSATSLSEAVANGSLAIGSQASITPIQRRAPVIKTPRSVPVIKRSRVIAVSRG